MMKLAITQYHIGIARDLSNMALRSVRGKNYTGVTAADRYFHGYLGELVVREWLAEKGKRHEHRIQSGGGQRPDFIVYQAVSNIPMRLEVKTASNPLHKYLMFPRSQKIEFDCIVGVRLDLSGQSGEIMGWLNRSRVEELPDMDMDFKGHKHQVRAATFVSLNPPDSLLSKLANAK